MRLLPLLASLLVAMACGARAQELAAPSGPVLLTVTGKISVSNSSDGAAFDRAALEALGLHRLRTSTAWTEGVPTFEGVLLCALLDRVGAAGERLAAHALNDYTAEIPVSDCRRYPVLLALRQDGQELSVRDKGPLWIVYPRDDFPELANDLINSRWVWQLDRITVE